MTHPLFLSLFFYTYYTYLIICPSRQFVVSSHFAAVNLLSGVTTVANLAAGSIGISRFAFVGITVKAVEVACNVLVAEVEEECRVQSHTTETGLKVEMRTGTSTRITTQANHIAGSYLFALSNELLREVTIDGLQTVVVYLP